MMRRFGVAIAVVGVVFAMGSSHPGLARAAKGKALDVAWLTKPAEQAVNLGQYAKAAVLYQGALALQPGDAKLLRRLATIYTMGGQFAPAQDTLRRYATVADKPADKSWATSEIKRLQSLPAPFINEDVSQVYRQRNFAFQALKRGRSHARRRRYKEAASYYEAALVMDPALVGVYRFLGTVYNRLKDRARAQAFYIKYLRLRPGGRLAARVRKRIKNSKQLGKVTFKASFKSAVYINRGRVGTMTPIKDVILPSGSYTVVLYNPSYHVARKVRVVVAPGTHQVVEFKFGVLQVKLKPWARIRANGRDIGLWDEVGLPVGQYTLRIVSHDGKKRMTKKLAVTAGDKAKIAAWQ